MDNGRLLDSLTKVKAPIGKPVEVKYWTTIRTGILRPITTKGSFPDGSDIREAMKDLVPIVLEALSLPETYGAGFVVEGLKINDNDDEHTVLISFRKHLADEEEWVSDARTIPVETKAMRTILDGVKARVEDWLHARNRQGDLFEAPVEGEGGNGEAKEDEEAAS